MVKGKVKPEGRVKSKSKEKVRPKEKTKPEVPPKAKFEKKAKSEIKQPEFPPSKLTPEVKEEIPLITKPKEEAELEKKAESEIKQPELPPSKLPPEVKEKKEISPEIKPEEEIKPKEKETKDTRGQRLRRSRKARGLSLEEAYQKTKIHIRVLKALEEDAVDQMAPAYVKGLLKIYCAFLGVDPQDFIEEPAKEKTVSLPLVKPRINISVIKKRIKLKPIILVVCLAIISIAAFKIGRNVSLYWASRSSKSTPPKIATKPEAPSLPAPAPVISKPSLGIRAKEDCWLEVKADDKTIFRSILKKGHFEYWEAKEEIEFSLGNAGGVDVEVNGKLLSPLGRRGQVIKNIKITKSGLRVPK